MPAAGTGSFATDEYRANWGLNAVSPIPAYEAGATGLGVSVAVIDTGLNVDHSDLDDNVDPNSIDIINNRPNPNVFGPDMHGTQVAGIIAAEKNDSGMHGVSFEALIMAIRIDFGDTCNSDGDCIFFTSDIIRAINYAVAHGARVINLSLGGDGASGDLIAALAAAVNAGVFIVISAGNDSEGNPSATAQVALSAGISGGMLIVGAIDSNGTLASFSNRAGNSRNAFVVAPGVDIFTTSNNNIYTRVNGTSYSAPHVAGAAALLFSLFPNLVGTDIFDILTQTATDFGASGVDNVYGFGLIDIGAALQPLGPQSIVTMSSTSDELIDIPMDDTGGGFSIAFGDAIFNARGFSSVMMLDGFRRSYMVDLSSRIEALYRPSLSLADAIESRRQRQSLFIPLSGDGSLSFSFYDRYRLIRDLAPALSMATQDLLRQEAPATFFQSTLKDDLTLSFAFGFSPGDVLMRQGDLNTAGYGFLTTNFGGATHLSLASSPKTVNLKKTTGGKVSLLFGVSTGIYNIAEFLPYAGNHPKATVTSTYIRAARKSGALMLNLTAGVMEEKNAVLGSISTGALTLGDGATTAFLGAQGEVDLGHGFSLFGQYEAGWTSVKGAEFSLIGNVSSFRTSSFTAALTKNRVFGKRDRIGIAVHQPLRVENGTLSLVLPTGRDYAIDRILFSNDQAGLSPSSREIDVEISYRLVTRAGFTFEANLVHQFNPGHTINLSHASAVLFRFTKVY
ncbi:MAG: S8 family serine peptidase [Proteobacteria bacterium]|nr:S8 family serine peptidase [Pseudomonadota bacterium]